MIEMTAGGDGRLFSVRNEMQSPGGVGKGAVSQKAVRI